MKREIWLSWRYRKPCPTCKIGSLEVPQNDRLLHETAESKELNNYSGYPCTDYIFSIHLKCNSCGERVAVSGFRSEENFPSDEEFGLQSSINPVSFFPAPYIIDIPSSCPKSVHSVLKESFRLYWVDVSSCANKIRIVIELLFDELNVISITIQGKKLTLHKRIEEFQKMNPKVGEILLAIKWIGNEGSHLSELKKMDVLDAYELLEYALELLFDDKEKRLLTLTQEINANKGKKTTPN